MSYKTDHPEQDPAEGSREVIDRELAHHPPADAKRKDKQTSDSRGEDKSGEQDHRPM
jgi:hypothetical protein